MRNGAKVSYLFGRAGCGVQSNNVTINHLFTHMFEIYCYIQPNDRLNLSNAPIGPIRVDHKITKAKIKQMRISYGFSRKVLKIITAFLPWLGGRWQAHLTQKTQEI